ncbi:MAG: hypothetical protein Q9157_007152 [Trypethelium eluteriae]
MSVPPTWPLFKPFCQRFAHIVSRSSSHLSSGKHYENKGDGASTDNVLRIRQERGFELTSEHRLSRDMKRTSYLEIEEDE